MVTLSRRADLGRVEPRALGAHIQRRFEQGVARAQAARDRADPRRFFDVPFERLVADPADTVRAIRDHFDLPVTEEGMGAVDAWLQSPREDGPGRHRYSTARATIMVPPTDPQSAGDHPLRIAGHRVCSPSTAGSLWARG